ncbi:MAG: hypothetical protein ACE5D8_00290 [Fidelibacterota bacterium]
MKKYRKIAFFITALFLVQWIAQSIPHHETIMVGGEDVCTCGCGHTVAVCAASHQSLTIAAVDCSCQHQQTKTSQVVVAPHKILDLDVHYQFSFLPVFSTQQYAGCSVAVLHSALLEIPSPPPKTTFG